MRYALPVPFVCLVFVLAVPPAEQPPNTLSPEERAAGWQLLFDGKTMRGWDDPARKTPAGDSWTIEDGCLKALPRARIREDLETTRAFRDFELVFDWKIGPGANSGVKYLVQQHVLLDSTKLKPGAKRFEEMVGYELEHHLADRGKIAPAARAEDYLVSFEYQVIDNGRNPDALRGSLYAAGSLYGLVPPSEPAVRPVGEFNHSRLVLRGKHVRHWLNGVKVVDTQLDSKQVLDGLAKRWHDTPVYDLLAKLPRRDCPIALQNHGDPAWFRNLKIRALN